MSPFYAVFYLVKTLHEPRREKTYLRGFRPGPTQTGLYNNRKWLENLTFLVKIVEGLFFLCSERKGLGNHPANLCLCFRIFKHTGFLITRLKLSPLRSIIKHTEYTCRYSTVVVNYETDVVFLFPRVKMGNIVKINNLYVKRSSRSVRASTQLYSVLSMISE